MIIRNVMATLLVAGTLVTQQARAGVSFVGSLPSALQYTIAPSLASGLFTYLAARAGGFDASFAKMAAGFFMPMFATIGSRLYSGSSTTTVYASQLAISALGFNFMLRNMDGAVESMRSHRYTAPSMLAES